MSDPGGHVATEADRQDARVELLTHWKVLLGAFVGVFFGINTSFFYISGALLPMQIAELGWRRVDFGLPIMAVGIVGLITSPFIGRLIDRFGALWLAVPSLLLSAAAFMLLSTFNGGVLTFFLMVLALAIAGAGTSVVTYLSLVGKTFDKARGLAIGVTMAGTGVSGFVLPQIATRVGEASGWRSAYVVLAGIAVIVAAVTFLLLRKARVKAARGDISALQRTLTGMTLREAVRTPAFWALAVFMFLMASAITGLVPNFVAMLTERGYSPEVAVNIAGTIGLSVIVGRVAAGALLDRISAGLLGATFAICAGIGFILLASGTGTMVLAAGAVLVGIAMGAEIDVAGYVVAARFGQKHYGAIYGWQYAVFAAGGILSHPFIGWLYDISGSYRLGLYVSAGALFLATPLTALFRARSNPQVRLSADTQNQGENGDTFTPAKQIKA